MRYEVYYGDELISDGEVIHTAAEANEFIQEVINEWWPDHPTHESEYRIEEVGE